MNKRAKICLNAMVGNEAPTIKRMLESVAPYINYWVIQCNGKEDDTERIINEFFKDKGITGFTYQVDWNFPGWNRDHTLQECLKADHGCDWILRMDADERLHVDSDFDWSILDDTSVQSYNITAQASDTRYFRTWFWNAKLPWFFQHDKRHETIHLPEIGEGFQRLIMPYGFRHLVSHDGETWFVPRKFLRDALELEIDKVVGDKVNEDHYHLFYIAKSYFDSYGDHTQYAFGKEHSLEYCRRSIWYFHKYMEKSHNWTEGVSPTHRDEMAYFALSLMAGSYIYMGEIERGLKFYDYAQEFIPERNESLLYKCFELDKLGRIDELKETLDFMVRPERTNPFPQLSFLIEDRAYYNSGNFLNEWRERLNRKETEYVIDSDSVDFFA
jgi:hypothetical protein